MGSIYLTECVAFCAWSFEKLIKKIESTIDEVNYIDFMNNSSTQWHNAQIMVKKEDVRTNKRGIREEIIITISCA